MILRQVKKTDFYQTSSHPHGCWSVMLLLECDHVLRRKSSAWGGGRVKCKECEDAQ